MKLIDLKFSRLIPGPAAAVFDVWFDPESPGGPWHGAKKVIMNLAVDGMRWAARTNAAGRSCSRGSATTSRRPAEELP